eukprot:Sspe_Gene.53626::Locus_29624_Transcript_1_1_Confidence_1.000_Length_863::g.53626::m.53626/K05857/PLCD; phosphatidylinositol phospholipase C, delta
MGCVKSTARRWDEKHAIRISKVVLQELAELQPKQGYDSQRWHYTSLRDVALALHHEHPTLKKAKMVETVVEAAKGTPMESSVDNLTVNSLPDSAMSSRSVRSIVAWYRADADGNGRVTISELESVLKSLNIAATGKRLHELLDEYDTNSDRVLSFGEFAMMWRSLVAKPDLEELFQQYARSDKHFLLTANELQRFLTEQGDTAKAEDIIRVHLGTGLCISDNGSDGFTMETFCDWLMDVHDNSPIDSKKRTTVYHDMTQPLHHYFINSSHNTYLTGHQ